MACSGRPVYVQWNGLANTRLKYAMKFNSLLSRSSTDVNEPRRITFLMITPKTVSIWFWADQSGYNRTEYLIDDVTLTTTPLSSL